METLVATKPKLGFVGMGWIGKSRLKAIMNGNHYKNFAVTDPDDSVFSELEQEISNFQKYATLEEMLESDVEGIVIASPSALHAEQSLKALKSGKAVFCQKPLGRDAEETQKVVQVAEEQNLLLQVDFSYRYTEAIQQIKQIIQNGDLGSIYGIDLTFHNAYGPDKAWYKNPELSGGGCLMDLGIHLIDLLYWVFEDPEFSHHQSQYFHRGNSQFNKNEQVEDYAVAQSVMNGKTAVQLNCSWFLPAGKDAIIEATFYGDKGGLSFKNINGSFYDFKAERYTGTQTEILTSPPDNWEGKAAAIWAEELAEGKKFDPKAQNLVKVAQELENYYNAKT